MNGLHRYWIKLGASTGPICQSGVGVTAWSVEDAIALLADASGFGLDAIEITTLVEDVDLRSLDANHVLPNITSPSSVRGIWFPQGYEGVIH